MSLDQWIIQFNLQQHQTSPNWWSKRRKMWNFKSSQHFSSM